MKPQKSGLVALAGRPNAGKSTLLNKVLGSQISIVTPKPQTTRERVHGILTNDQGQIVFVDTPGIHRAKENSINTYMVQEARRALEGPSLIWYLVDPFSTFEHEKIVIDHLSKAMGEGITVYVLFNKLDLVSLKKNRLQFERYELLKTKVLEELAKKKLGKVETHFISAKTGDALPKLLQDTWDALPEGPFLYPDSDDLSDRPVRFFVAEKVREQLFLQLGEELPYSCAVKINTFQETKKPIRIEATILVERDSQKGMVIGQGGQKIKEIGTAARVQIESFVGEPIFLGLKVEVLKNWSKNSRALKDLGYHFGDRK